MQCFVAANPSLIPPLYWWESFQWCRRCKWISALIRVMHLRPGWSHILLLTFSHHLFGRFRAESDIPNAPSNKTYKKKVVASGFPSCGEMIKLQLRLRKQQGASDQSAPIQLTWMKWFGLTLEFSCVLYMAIVAPLVMSGIYNDVSVTPCVIKSTCSRIGTFESYLQMRHSLDSNRSPLTAS